MNCWYVTYGSNLDPNLLGRYLPGATGRESRWVQDDRDLYFAGTSGLWDGGVAFLSLTAGSGDPAQLRAYAATESELATVLRGENGQSELELPDLGALAVGDHVEAAAPLSADGRLGKYNAILRLADIDGSPAYTVTTSRNLPRRAPSTQYLAAIRGGLLDLLDGAATEKYLAAAVNRSTG